MIEFLIVALVAFLISFGVYIKKLLTLGGAISVFMLIIIIDIFSDWKMASLLIISYVLLSIIDKVFERNIEKSVDGIHEKSGKRVASQVWYNGGVAAISIILYGITGKSAFLMGYLVALGEAFADSLASDVGVMSKKPPIDICTFKTVQNGLSGGVSLLGTGASTLGVILYIGIARLFIPISLINMILLVIITLFGNLLDSVMGSRLQIKYKCEKCGTITEKKLHCQQETLPYSGFSWMNNSIVNLISNSVTALIGIICFLFI
ncbi:MAG: DUF92 domain-containing protein [Treponema sp.]|nr:DUF92 domain-containing protein [Treponema sp.]